MRPELKRRLIICVALVVLCLLVVFWPRATDASGRQRSAGERAKDFISFNEIKADLQNNIHLGLDLKGGTHLVMQVQWQDAVVAKTKRNQAQARQILQKESIPFTDIKTNVIPDPVDPTSGTLPPGQFAEVSVIVPDSSKNSDIETKLLADFNSNTLTGKGWTRVAQTATSITFRMTDQEQNQIADKATNDAEKIVNTRINAFGVAEPQIQQGAQGSHQIILQLPGVDDPERVKKLLNTGSVLQLGLMVGNQFPTREAAEAARQGDPNKQVFKYTEGGDQWAVIEVPPVITGEDLRGADAVTSRAGTDVYEIAFYLTAAGATKFEAFTRTHIQQRLAIVLNGEVKSAPTIQSTISDNGRITGSFSKESAEDLALTLRSGALPARIIYLEERTVGPSLGADSIKAGVLSSVAGLIAIIAFMLFYYRGSGINAIAALIINLIILMAGLISFSAVLTLPGIAGVILTIGMAVDSNVLIFERIREELRGGKTVPSAVDTGFKRAFVAIIDTHVTTIVSSLFLFLFGTGPVRGFAVTLAIGLLANLFSSVYVSRTMFNYILSGKESKVESLSI